MEVPDFEVVEQDWVLALSDCASADTRGSPGATRSGLKRPSGAGPADAKEEIVLRRGCDIELDADTAFLDKPGDKIDWYP